MNTKVRYPLGKVWIEVEAQSVKEAIKELSDYAQVFSHHQCLLCGSEHVMPKHRVSKGFDFYQMACMSCGAELSFGQTREGERLFPKRRDQNGNEIGKGGWHQYEATQRDGGEF